MSYKTLEISLEKDIVLIKLNRVEVNNAFNEVMINELTQSFQCYSEETALRAIVLTGNGKNFSAGADIQYMKRTAEMDYEQNRTAAIEMAKMFHTINDCPHPVIGKVHGAALGGGFGLCAVCDIVIAEENTIFGLTEVKLGLLPAVIGPFAIAKIGYSNFRWLGMTGERFNAKIAKKIGLVHKCCTFDTLDIELNNTINQIREAGPTALRYFKTYLQQMNPIQTKAFLDISTELISKVRTSDEGKEGLTAFLEKRKPKWSN